MSNMLFIYTQMKMAYLSQTSPNTISIGEVCVRLDKRFLTSLIGKHWATSGLQVTLSSVKGVFIIFPLFLLEGDAILQIAPRLWRTVHYIGL